MPKAEKGSLKDLAKSIKAKGLQKLKFYCQMCEKQCRDANGFKCHLTSESHLRQMKVFSERSGSILKSNSREFEKTYLDTLRMRHSTAKVNANHVYQQVISDKGHIHMNGTIWSSLTAFVQYLGRSGKCLVEETERGWYISYIDRDPEKMQREEAQRRRQELELEAENIAQQRWQKQREEAAKALDRACGGVVTLAEASKILEHGTAIPNVQLELSSSSRQKKKKINPNVAQITFGDDDDDEEDAPKDPVDTTSVRNKPPPNKKRPPAEATTKVDNNKRAKTSDDAWLDTNIWVRIVNKKLMDHFRCKAVVKKLVDDYTAEIQVKGGDVEGDVLRLDQDDLETVVPKKVDEKVRIVRGKRRGETAVVKKLDKTKCLAVLKLSNGTTLDRVDYDDFSKLA